MKLLAGVLLGMAMGQGGRRVTPEPRYFRYSRVVAGATVAGQRVCSVMDAGVLAHAQANLADLRLMVLESDGSREIPYALTISRTVGEGTQVARVLRRQVRGRRQVVELEMPRGPYSEVRLRMTGKDFIATAKVTGLRSLAERLGVAAGTFTLFDLSGQGLGRETTLRLAEGSYPVLRVELEGSGVDGGPMQLEVSGAEVPPSREAQTVFTAVAESSRIVQQGQESVAHFEIPARLPVERVSFSVAGGGNFSRMVEVRARAAGTKNAAVEQVSGEIGRVQWTGPAGQAIDEERLKVRATLGVNATAAAGVEVAVENGDQPPLAIRAVRLEMRRRELCFDAPGEPVTLFYGDKDLGPPVYDYARVFPMGEKMEMVGLGVEKRNPRFIGRDPARSVTESHPELVWLVLMGVVGVFGMVGYRSAAKEGS